MPILNIVFLGLLFIHLSMKLSPDLSPEYTVKKMDAGAWTPDGSGRHPAWQQADSLTAFRLYWNEEEPPPTAFKALWTEGYLYFLFEVVDPQRHARIVDNHKLEVVASDRIELFFRIDDAMTPYYCLEIDYLGRILDYKADFYRKMDFEWSWPAGGIEVATAVADSGYSVEGRITLASLRSLGLLQGNQLRTGLFRADYTRAKSGDKTNVRWISWINPGTEKPDFHVPAAFGRLVLVE